MAMRVSQKSSLSASSHSLMIHLLRPGLPRLLISLSSGCRRRLLRRRRAGGRRRPWPRWGLGLLALTVDELAVLLLGDLVGDGEHARAEVGAAADGAAHAGGDAARHLAVVVGALEVDDAAQDVVMVLHGHAAVDGGGDDAEAVDCADDGSDAGGDEEDAHAIAAKVAIDGPDEGDEGPRR